MPFDGTKFTETKPDVFSLEGLVAWLETQDPAREYRFWNYNGGCLLSIYLAEHGQPFGSGDPDKYSKIARVTRGDVGADYIDVAYDRPHIYGAALDRARKLLAAR